MKMNTNLVTSLRIRILLTVFGIFLASVGCNSDDSGSFSIDGQWEAAITGADAEIALILTGEGKNGIAGLADVTAPPAPLVQGDVSGTRKGKDVEFTIEVNDVIVGGSIVFEGAFQSEGLIIGTMDSGILGGTFPASLQRQGL